MTPDATADATPDATADATPDIHAYLEARTAGPAGFSPDGRRLLVSSDLPGTAQVHVLDLDGADLPVAASELRQLTDFEEPIGAGYLPANPLGDEGDRLLLATDRGGNERTQLFTAPADPPAPFGGPDDLDALVVDDDHIHRPGGVTRDGRLVAYATNRGDDISFDTWVRDLVTGEERCVLAVGGWTQPGGFSPDGRILAVTEVTEQAGDNRVWLVDLEVAGRDGPARPGDAGTVELAPHTDSAHVGTPSWLPDSSAFFFSTDVDREFIGVARGTPDGSWEYAIEPGWDSGCAVDWSGRHLLVATNEDGISRARLHDPASLEVLADVPLPGTGVAGGYRMTRDGRYVTFSFSSARVPGDAWRYDADTGACERVTVSPCDVPEDQLVEPELVRFPSFDGLEVPAFVFRPRASFDDGPAPVVVVIHGGPESQYRPSFAPVTQYLVAAGFAVVAPNVRGSTGLGRTYQHLDDVEKRFDAIRDLEALHAWLGTQDDLDQDRAALYGGSYGGYMVLAGLAFQPELWAAGVDIVGMSDLTTFLENTSSWRRRFREREYGSLEEDRELLRELSPITRVEQMRAPLFIIHGANDPRVPLSEAEQIHEVLTERGVRNELLVYDDEGHGLAKLPNRIDAYPKVVAFLKEVLSG